MPTFRRRVGTSFAISPKAVDKRDEVGICAGLVGVGLSVACTVGWSISADWHEYHPVEDRGACSSSALQRGASNSETTVS